MLACVSPADLNVDESLNTLRFASRASSIVNSVSVNHDEIATPSESIALRKEIQILKQQLDIFKMKCELLSTVNGGQPSTRIRGCESGKSECFKPQTPQMGSLIGIILALSSSLKNLLGKQCTYIYLIMIILFGNNFFMTFFNLLCIFNFLY
jgi:hypothetical protein